MQHDYYYENWKHESGLHIDSRWLCSETKHKKAVAQERHGMIV
jgi:hypothetical protein